MLESKGTLYISKHLVLKRHYRSAIFFELLHLLAPQHIAIKGSQSLTTYEERDANTVIYNESEAAVPVESVSCDTCVSVFLKEQAEMLRKVVVCCFAQSRAIFRHELWRIAAQLDLDFLSLMKNLAEDCPFGDVLMGTY